MEGHELSHGEQRALYAMEQALRLDAATLDRRLRTMTPRLRHRLFVLAGRPLTHLALLLGIGSLVLLVAGIRTSSLAVIWTFAGCWTAAMLTAWAAARAPRRESPPRR